MVQGPDLSRKLFNIMQKYNEDLVEQVRSGKAQIQVDSDSTWGELLRIIFPVRTGLAVGFNYYYQSRNSPDRYKRSDTPHDILPIIHAKDFLIEEKEVNWIEVRDGVNYKCIKDILLTDIGVQFNYRYLVLDPGKEEKYINGESDLDVTAFRFMRPISQPEPLTHNQLEELIGKPFKYVPE